MRAVSKKKAAENRLKPFIRGAVFARDRYQCQLQGVEGVGGCFGGLTPHHIRKASQGGAYSEENLATLCSSHNDRIESDADLAAIAHARGLVKLRGDQ